MPYFHVHAFIDGGFLLERGAELGVAFPDPFALAYQAVRNQSVQRWAQPLHSSDFQVALARVTYYDAAPDDFSSASPERRAYWQAIERIPDTALGFGYLRGRKGRQPRQKGVDTLIAVDMLVGAFSGLFPIALLVAGDADFIPVIDEVRRRGVQVFLVTTRSHSSEDLWDAADQVLFIGRENQEVPLEALAFSPPAQE